jgi:outer membrane receptor protein involved in Fe transport
VRYQPFDESLTLRATYTEAFHAPNLSDLAPSGSESGVFVPDEVIDPLGLTPNGTAIRVLSGGQPNLRPEVAYGWNYGFVWTPSFINGLTISADYYHIDLRDRTNFIDPNFIVAQNFASGGKEFPGQVVRDPATGRIILIRDLIQNIARTITEGIDYELVYAFNTSVLNHGNLGTFTFTLNGTYLSRYVATINIGDHEREFAGQIDGPFGSLAHHRIYGSLFYDLGGLDAGVTVHYIGQQSDSPFETVITGKPPRKVREWTTVDAIASYTFKYPAPASAGGQVPGYAKDGGKSASANDGKAVPPVSTASYGTWKGWLNGTTITAGVNNVFDLDPPFGFLNFENGYDESAFSIQGRFWYVALKKRF